MIEANVPPGNPPWSLAAVVLSARGTWPRVFEARCTKASDGIESNPQ
jgi:hypothetical protein